MKLYDFSGLWPPQQEVPYQANSLIFKRKSSLMFCAYSSSFLAVYVWQFPISNWVVLVYTNSSTLVLSDHSTFSQAHSESLANWRWPLHAPPWVRLQFIVSQRNQSPSVYWSLRSQLALDRYHSCCVVLVFLFSSWSSSLHQSRACMHLQTKWWSFCVALQLCDGLPSLAHGATEIGKKLIPKMHSW